ncbi:MAG: tripartite tricarboxylate transporter permease [Syntrophales bacterium]
MDMIEIGSLLLQGFSRMLDLKLLFLCLCGTTVGTLVGVLPGLGPAAAIAILLPLIYGVDPLSALVALSGVYYGAMYGGTITSVLLNLPGESAAVVTTFDGYPMAQQGRGGVALGISAIGSFVAGTFGIFFLTLIAVPLSRMALKFGPPEQFAVMVLVFSLCSSLTEGGLIKSLLSLFVGLLFACVGQDVVSGSQRLTWGAVYLMDGITFLPAVVGMYGLADVTYNIIHPSEFIHGAEETKLHLRDVFPSLIDLKDSTGSIIRGSIIGFIVGVLPGAGATIASFMSYGIEKRISKTPEKFGTGVIQGVAGPESANNGASSGAFVPLLALGIPGSSTTAVLLGAFIMVGIQPGPRLFNEHPDIVWGLIASMYVGNIMLLIMNVAFIPVFVWLLRISKRSLPVIIATLCFIGIYAMNNQMADVWMMLFFTALGYAFKVADIPASPLIIALVLGEGMEDSLRQALVMSKGSPALFFTRPISLVLLIASMISLAFPLIKNWYNRNANGAE